MSCSGEENHIKSQDKEKGSIILSGVCTHNLRDVDVSLPWGKMTVVTGVSGSGKSSLVFDTLYAEAYRRYVESLSSFARQYLRALPRPQIRSVSNLPPAVALQQRRGNVTSRSTVGTMTEIQDLLQVLFVHLAQVICPGCGARIVPATAESAARELLESCPAGHEVLILAPMHHYHGSKLTADDLQAQLQAQGFSRLWHDGRLLKLGRDGVPRELSEWCVVVDQGVVDAAELGRLVEALSLARRLGRGRLGWVVAAGVGDMRPPMVPTLRSASLECVPCGRTFLPSSLGLFSFNHPLGACRRCQGFGRIQTLDWRRIVPDRALSLRSAGVDPWNFGDHRRYYTLAKESLGRAALKQRRDRWQRPFHEYDDEDWQWLRRGDGEGFDGVEGYFQWLDSQKYKAHYRIHGARFRRYETCPQCHGRRLCDDALVYRLAGASLGDVLSWSLDSLRAWQGQVAAEEGRLVHGGASSQGAEGRMWGSESVMPLSEAMEELASRLTCLGRLGLGYLALGRSSRTLSGGEFQRINLARCLGAAMTETLYCLDEPTTGLHARDSANLVEVLEELRDQGNTLVVVEHERTVLARADHVIEVGPEAGHRGGQIIAAGSPLADLQGPVVIPSRDRVLDEAQILLRGCAIHNLKRVDVALPRQGITVVCGVSGSGKTSLVRYSLVPLMQRCFDERILDDAEGGESADDDESDALAVGLGVVANPESVRQGLRHVALVTQDLLGRSRRSNIATYTKVMDGIRNLLAKTEAARRLDLKPGYFSFNSPGGRCETCAGLGTISQDLSFLGEMDVICPTCSGRRFSDEVFDVRWNGKNLLEILSLTVAQAREFFFAQRDLAQRLQVLVDFGLGYLTLGQHTSSFSGGEAQRLKLAEFAMQFSDRERSTGLGSMIVLDEPTTGLSDRDVEVLMEQFQYLARLGHCVVIVEHHLHVIAQADWVIEMGPEAGAAGGEVVYQGPPEGLVGCQRSRTGAFLSCQSRSAKGRKR